MRVGTSAVVMITYDEQFALHRSRKGSRQLHFIVYRLEGHEGAALGSLRRNPIDTENATTVTVVTMNTGSF
jgi:hypothetical protein